MKELFCGVALSILSLLSACGAATNAVPAPDSPHTQCAVVFLDTGTVGPSCVAADICELLTCGTGSCVVLDSDPAQVTCGR